MAQKIKHAAYIWLDSKVHHIFDTGFQLLTGCGKRVTYLGSDLNHGEFNVKNEWRDYKEVNCFNCIPSPLAFWTNP